MHMCYKRIALCLKEKKGKGKEKNNMTVLFTLLQLLI